MTIDGSMSEPIKASSPCADCGGRFPPEAMQRDHPPGVTKVANISSLQNRRSTTLLKAEVAKCELVCANCHAVRTYHRRVSSTARR